jgi:hypothetical protein
MMHVHIDVESKKIHNRTRTRHIRWIVYSKCTAYLSKLRCCSGMCVHLWLCYIQWLVVLLLKCLDIQKLLREKVLHPTKEFLDVKTLQQQHHQSLNVTQSQMNTHARAATQLTQICRAFGIHNPTNVSSSRSIVNLFWLNIYVNMHHLETFSVFGLKMNVMRENLVAYYVEFILQKLWAKIPCFFGSFWHLFLDLDWRARRWKFITITGGSILRYQNHSQHQQTKFETAERTFS